MNRGDMWDAELGLTAGARPVVVVTCDEAIPVLSRVTVAPASPTVRGLPSEVEVGPTEGLDYECVISCDNIVTLSKGRLTRRRGELGPEAIRRLDAAIVIALGIG
jgi:mRNA interferase MazF